MSQLPVISASDIKDWWTRHGQDIGLDDPTVEEIAARGNARAQRLEDEREAARMKHLRQESGDHSRRVIDDGSTPSPGNSLPIYPIKCPAPMKEELIQADRRIAAKLVDIPGADCREHDDKPVSPIRQPAPEKRKS